VYEFVCYDTYVYDPMFRGVHRVSRKRERVSIGGTLASTSEQIKIFFAIVNLASHVASIYQSFSKKINSYNSKVSCLIILVHIISYAIRGK